MKKFTLLAIALLFSASTVAQTLPANDPMESEFQLKKQQFAKAQANLNAAYARELTSLQTKVAESKLSPNPDLLKRIEEEMSTLGIASTDKWYYGRWKINSGSRDIFVLITNSGLVAINEKTGTPVGSTKEVIVLSDTKINATTAAAEKIIWTKTSPSGDKARVEWFADRHSQGSNMTATKVSAN